MQKNKEENYAFIDSQNVNLAIRDQWWKLNWTKLYKHLVKKYKCEKVYIFIGYIERNKIIYNNLENIWYSLIFKPTKEFPDWKIKGNVDAELVLQSMIDYEKYDKAIIITWDWDFACLVKYLKNEWKLRTLIVPNLKKYSYFLKKEWWHLIDSLSNKRERLEYFDKK